MARIPMMAGNWKMNKTVEEAIDLVRQLKRSTAGVDGVEVAVAPPFTALHAVKKELQGSSIRLAAQNVFWEEKGAFTGEIAPLMLREIGCDYVIVGHSERRQFFGETDETVNRRLKAVLGQGMKPIFCIGETLQERESGKTFSVLERQVAGGLFGLQESAVEAVVVAYEPVWAIGTGKTASPEQAQAVHAAIRTMLSRQDEALAVRVRILYGGSVKAANAGELFAMADIDGALVGGASLDAKEFLAICEAAGTAS